MFALVTWFYAIFCSKFLSVLFYALFPTMISVLKASRKQANNLRPVWFVYLAFFINQFMNMEGKTLLEEGEKSEIWRGEKYGCVNAKLLWMGNSSFDLSIKKGGRFLPAGKWSKLLILHYTASVIFHNTIYEGSVSPPIPTKGSHQKKVFFLGIFPKPVDPPPHYI